MKIQIMTRHILDPTKSDLFEEATNTYKIGLYNLLVCLSTLYQKVKRSISNTTTMRGKGEPLK